MRMIEDSMVFKNSSFIRGIINALPIVLGYIPIGFAYGVLAQKAGLSIFNIAAMSLVVFAGSAQFIAVAMFSAGLSPSSIIVTTFVVNLRHILMSASLSPFLKGWKPLEIAAFSYEITDETFAVHTSRFNSGSPVKEESYGTNITAHSSWIIGSILGLYTSTLINDVKPLGLDYALIAMFIGLTVLQINKMSQMAAALIAGVLSVILFLSGLEQWNVILAAIVAATAGVFIEKKAGS
jgi:4-azaleucine resistance transporter AzlC